MPENYSGSGSPGGLQKFSTIWERRCLFVIGLCEAFSGVRTFGFTHLWNLRSQLYANRLKDV